jgi:two-component system LytT family response regulator
MRVLKALIVDDERLARERLKSMLAADPGVEVIGECADGDEALTALRFARPDVVFLDIQLPGCDGLSVAARLPAEARPAIVFTTAHERFAVDAFGVAAVDYLLKPFDRERLAQSIARVREQLCGMQMDGPAGRPERIAFRTGGRLVLVRPAEVLWAEASDNYVTVHLVDGRLLVRETLASIEGRLPPGQFARVNRSALVQFDQIKELQPALHGDYTVVLRDGTRLPLSRSLRGQLERFAGGNTLE